MIYVKSWSNDPPISRLHDKRIRTNWSGDQPTYLPTNKKPNLNRPPLNSGRTESRRKRGLQRKTISKGATAQQTRAKHLWAVSVNIQNHV